MDWMSVPAGTDNYAFPALFSVPKGRKITPSYSNGRQNIVLSIRQLITCVVQQFSRLTKSIRNPQRCDSCSVSVGVGTPLIARLRGQVTTKPCSQLSPGVAAVELWCVNWPLTKLSANRTKTKTTWQKLFELRREKNQREQQTDMFVVVLMVSVTQLL